MKSSTYFLGYKDMDVENPLDPKETFQSPFLSPAWGLLFEANLQHIFSAISSELPFDP